MERPSRESKIRCIRPYHRDEAPEPLLELAGPPGVEFDGDDLVTGIDQGAGDRAGAGADVEDERAVGECGVRDETGRGLRVELVPSPAWLQASHGGGPS